tara:strand:+ start:155 stop:499 length:345 start_codon:yes stop_codon:yes gene_type:complete
MANTNEFFQLFIILKFLSATFGIFKASKKDIKIIIKNFNVNVPDEKKDNIERLTSMSTNRNPIQLGISIRKGLNIIDNNFKASAVSAALKKTKDTKTAIIVISHEKILGIFGIL